MTPCHCRWTEKHLFWGWLIFTRRTGMRWCNADHETKNETIITLGSKS